MKFRYYVIYEDGDVTGTNDEVVAKEATEWAMVIDAQEGKMLPWADGDTRSEEELNIPEFKLEG